MNQRQAPQSKKKQGSKIFFALLFILEFIWSALQPKDQNPPVTHWKSPPLQHTRNVRTGFSLFITQQIITEHLTTPSISKQRLIKTLQEIFVGNADWKAEKRPPSSSSALSGPWAHPQGLSAPLSPPGPPHAPSAPTPGLCSSFSWWCLGMAQGRGGPQLAPGTQFGWDYTSWEKKQGRGTALPAWAWTVSFAFRCRERALAYFTY